MIPRVKLQAKMPVCPICKQQFSTKKGVNVHKRVHTGRNVSAFTNINSKTHKIHAFEHIKAFSKLAKKNHGLRRHIADKFKKGAKITAQTAAKHFILLAKQLDTWDTGDQDVKEVLTHTAKGGVLPAIAAAALPLIGQALLASTASYGVKKILNYAFGK